MLIKRTHIIFVAIFNKVESSMNLKIKNNFRQIQHNRKNMNKIKKKNKSKKLLKNNNAILRYINNMNKKFSMN